MGRLVLGEVVRKVKHSSVRTENPLQALYRGAEYFSLAMTFLTVWGVIFFAWRIMVGSSWLGIVTELRDGKSCEL